MKKRKKGRGQEGDFFYPLFIYALFVVGMFLQKMHFILLTSKFHIHIHQKEKNNSSNNNI